MFLSFLWGLPDHFPIILYFASDLAFWHISTLKPRCKKFIGSNSYVICCLNDHNNGSVIRGIVLHASCFVKGIHL